MMMMMSDGLYIFSVYYHIAVPHVDEMMIDDKSRQREPSNKRFSIAGQF